MRVNIFIIQLIIDLPILFFFQAVYFYDSDGRGPCLAIDGDKQALCSYKNYLVTIKQNRYVRFTPNV